MASFALHRSLLRIILLSVTCALACSSFQVPAAFAQRPGHIGGGGHPSGRIAPPHVIVPRSVLRRRVFFGAPFFRTGFGLGFNPAWWPTCGVSWGWGFNCYSLPFYTYSFENYLTPQAYETPVYWYGREGHDLVWLYLKNGSVYRVTDYWFVNSQAHFTMIEDDPTKPIEHVIPFDELDLQKTTYINTHRGFRIVYRDAPWQQYLRDHPDVTPTDMPPPQNN